MERSTESSTDKNDTAVASPGTLTDRNQLNAILSRAVTASRLAESDSLSDDLRLIAAIGARFLGRAAYAWLVPEDEHEHLAACARLAERVHTEVDPTVVLQACLFEAIYPAVDRIAIPEHVFRDLDQEPQARTFSYEQMHGGVPAPAQGLGSPWAGGAVPELAKPEALRWFYYRACRYIDAGYEALHIGQVHLIAGTDRGYRNVERLVAAIRSYAARAARRGWVILDAHSHGIARNGRLLFDCTSRPLSARPIVSQPETIALLRRGTVLPGVHPGGWSCRDAPVLLEVDNWHGYSLAPDPSLWIQGRRRAAAGRWGWDDISWFAHQEPRQRREFLAYAHAWAQLQGPEWHFQPPIRRPLGRAELLQPDGTPIKYYHANRSSAACPGGFGDEDAIAALWRSNSSRSEPENATADLAIGAAITDSGLQVPEPVALVGEIQEHIGGIVGDASCPWSRLHHIGGGVFARRFVFPLTCDLRFTVATGGTLTDPTNDGGLSGGSPFALRVARPGQCIEISFDYEAKTVRAIDCATRDSALVPPEQAVDSAQRYAAQERDLLRHVPPDWY